ncbi:endonuclease V [Singulisphaera sp. PoT]|uniref:endonuclease V n=1 Tax=Singulisphaera sp. PoT TaxID=3411797 RepID=UPI003BF6044D
MSIPRIVCLDVDYRDAIAVAAGVWFRGWDAVEAEHEVVATFDEVAPYQPGEFFRRELPCLLAVLERGPAADLIIVDGYVWLGPGRPGLGAHLFEAQGKSKVVVGVAKTKFQGATDAIPVYRGESHSPLYIKAEGIDQAEAAASVIDMHGPYRVPTQLRRVDQLARTSYGKA